MAIFGTKKNKGISTEVKEKKVTKKTAPKAEKALAPVSVTEVSSVAGVILRPRVTEKSGLLSQNGVYTFEISTTANKNLVAKAVTSLYKVIPVKVAIINSPDKKVFVRGRRGVVSGIRKAVVTLKKGDKIDFV